MCAGATSRTSPCRAKAITTAPRGLAIDLRRTHSQVMAFPRSFVDQLRDRVSIAEIVGKRLDWDARKSNPARGDLWACCPFHGEKTPSFHVDDQKGYFYCFGCGEKGDALGFVMKNDNLAFHEAVKLLAGEAGIPVPEQDPREREREEKRTTLVDVMELAQGFFRMQLSAAAAGHVRSYLDGRALSAETLEKFGIGYAPEARGALSAFLAEKGVDRALVLEAGLCGRRDDGTEYDRFRDRVMFPIRDPRGQVIAFGGRAMSDAAQAKYLNSPETPLFSKSRTLYNYGPARTAAGKGHTIIVAEGYMDVIALAQAGFEASVAPLGTALTEDQLGMIWRVTPEPVLALDGDEAGQRAAMRAAELALPRLEAGKTLRFALLPLGSDPDDLIRAGGTGAMRDVLQSAVPLSDHIWQKAIEARPIDTPERRADFDQRIRALLGRIENKDVRAHYRDAYREKRQELFRPSQPPSRQGGGNRNWRPGQGPQRPVAASNETRRSRLAHDSAESPNVILERAILAQCLKCPENLSDVAESLGRITFSNRPLDLIRAGLISAVFDLTDSESALSENHLLQEIEKRLDHSLRSDLRALSVSVTEGDFDALSLALSRYAALLARDAERAEAKEQLESASDGAGVERLLKAKTDYERELASGLKATHDDEKDASVQPFIDQELWKRPGRTPRSR